MNRLTTHDLTKRFTAAPDKLRSLKNGANPSLLTNWVGLVFATPKRLGEEQFEALRVLAKHPYLPTTGLQGAGLPVHALLDAPALELCVALGMDLKNIDPGPHQNVRRAALMTNAPSQTHVLLDLAGVPEVGLPDLAKAMRRMVDEMHIDSLRYLLEHRPNLLKQACQPHNPLLTNAVGRWVTAFEKEQFLKRANVMLHLLSQGGATWEQAIQEQLARYSTPQPWHMAIRTELAQWKAAYLEKAWSWAKAEEEQSMADAPKPKARVRL